MSPPPHAVGDTKLFIRARRYGITQKKRGVVTESEEELYGEDGTVYYRFINAGFLIGGNGIKSAGQSNADNIAVPDRDPDHIEDRRHRAPRVQALWRLQPPSR